MNTSGTPLALEEYSIPLTEDALMRVSIPDLAEILNAANDAYKEEHAGDNIPMSGIREIIHFKTKTDSTIRNKGLVANYLPVLEAIDARVITFNDIKER